VKFGELSRAALVITKSEGYGKDSRDSLGSTDVSSVYRLFLIGLSSGGIR